jgi:hypothetical protein
MYLALRPPWGRGAAAPSDAGVVAITAPADAGVAGKPKKKPRHRPAGMPPAAPGAPEDYEESEPPPPPLTDADRRLEWRGDDVTLPPTKIDVGGTGEVRPLEDNEINATISGQAGGVRDCVVQGATNTDLRATITVKMVVDGSGRVTRSKLQAPHYLFEHNLLGCVQRALGKMKFPAVGGNTSVTLPVTLG